MGQPGGVGGINLKLCSGPQVGAGSACPGSNLERWSDLVCFSFLVSWILFLVVQF